MTPKKKKKAIVLPPILIFLGLLILAILLVRSSFSWANYNQAFTVDTINLQGQSIIPSDEYFKTMKIEKGLPIQTYSFAQLSRQLETHPYVKAARFSQDFPNGVNIEIVERKPIAMIDAGPMYLIDDNHVILPGTENAYQLEIPMMSNFSASPQLYSVGKKTLSKKVITASTLIAQIKNTFPDLYLNVSEIRLNTSDEYEIILMEEPTRILLGVTDLWEKIQILSLFEQALKSRKKLTDYTYLDLRYEKQIIAKERKA